jgi:ubiquinone/menaquinone biosynthesis C-methylase UbiE
MILSKPNATILDVGAGVGRDASQIAKLISTIIIMLNVFMPLNLPSRC